MSFKYKKGFAINTCGRYYQIRSRSGKPDGKLLPLVYYEIPAWRDGDGPFAPTMGSSFGLN